MVLTSEEAVDTVVASAQLRVFPREESLEFVLDVSSVRLRTESM